MGKMYYVYIATNKWNTVFYVGITNDVRRRGHEHRYKLIPGFTSFYNINKIVWFHEFNTPEEAIVVEKKIKGGSRNDKIKLITDLNPEYKDLLTE